MPLTIRTSIQETPNKGLGLYTEEDLKKGQLIYKDDFTFEKIIPNKEVNKMSEVLKEFIHKYSSYTKSDDTWYLCCDNSRFFNHSNKPNTHFDENTGSMYTLVEIKKGEELTCDYTEFCDHCKDGNFGFTVE